MPAAQSDLDYELLYELELDWRIWLEEIYPDVLTYDFSDYPGYHCAFWDWAWSIRVNEKPPAFLTVWPRRGAKSSTVELSTVALGAKQTRKYVLYVCGTQTRANDHVTSVAGLMESRTLAQYYPAMGRPKLGVRGSVRGWRRNRLWTSNGFVVDGIGLDAATRGAKLEDQRPDYIILDDLDEETDTPAAVEKIIKILTRAILPAGSEDVAIVGAQNLVHRGSVFDQLVSYKTGFLANRIEAEPIPALLDFEYERRGRKTFILRGTPTWEGLSVAACQALIDDITIEAFEAECQHKVHVAESGAIYPMWSDSDDPKQGRGHIITWSQFERVFRIRHIPLHWRLSRGQDWGSTAGHPCVTTWLSKASVNAPMVKVSFAGKVYYVKMRGRVFAYRELLSIKQTPRQVAEAIVKLEAPHGESLRLDFSIMSHEAKSERDTYSVHHGLSFDSATPDRCGGIAQMKDYLQFDRSLPHPFHPDQLGNDGLWKLGCPSIFYIVDDDQFDAPVDDRGFARHRAEYPVYKWAEPVPGEPIARIVPLATFNDAADSDRIQAELFLPAEQPLSPEEQFEEAMPAALKREVAEALPPEEKGSAWQLREFHRHRLEKEDKGSNGLNWIYQRRNKV